MSNLRDLDSEIRSFLSKDAVHVPDICTESIWDFGYVKVCAEKTRRSAVLRSVVRETITPRHVSPNPIQLAPSDINHKTPQTLSKTSELTVYCTPQRTSHPSWSPPFNLATNSGCRVANNTRIHACCQAQLIHPQPKNKLSFRIIPAVAIIRLDYLASHDL
jgi:hypothetical protein